VNFDLGSFLGAILGGVITLVGVFLTINYYKKSDQKKLNLQIFSERPDLKVVDIKNKKRPDLEMVLVPIKGIKSFDDNWVSLDYNLEYAKPKSDLEYIDFYFENAGKTAISYISFLSVNQKYYSLFELYEDSIKKQIEAGDPHFEVFLDKRVDPGDVIKIRVYHGEKIYGNVISATISVAIIDTSERVYEQAFFYPAAKIYSSRLYEGGYRQYQKDIRIDTYMDYMIEKLKRNRNS
jgi:hypothetical protein